MTEYFCEYPAFSDAGAYRDVKISYRTVRRASDIRISDHIVNNGQPCRVLKISTIRDFCHFHTINILNGNFVPNIFHSSKDIDIPDVSRDLYQLMNISSKDNSVSLLHYTGDYTRDDIKLPENELLRTMMVGGIDHGKRVLVAVVSSLGKDAIYGVDVDQSGSDIRIKPNEDAVNQRITKDSDVVVNQSKTKDSDVAEKACLKEEATAKYGYEYTQRSYRDAVLGHNATDCSEDLHRIAAGAIANLAVTHTCQDKIIEIDGINVLASVADNAQDVKTVVMVAKAIANLCENNNLQKEPKVIETLFKMAEKWQQPKVFEEVARGIANFARETRQMKRQSRLLDSNHLAWIFENVENKNSAIRLHLEIALCHLVHLENRNRRKIKEKVEIIAKNSSNEDIRSFAEKTLNNID